MIPYKVFPMFKLGPLRFNLYGLMFALGIGVASYLAGKAAEKHGIKRDIINDLTFIIIISAIIGARLFYVVFYWPTGTPLSFWDIFKIWEGGIAFFGGFLGALLGTILFIRKKGLDFWTYADLYTLPLIIGHILGRIGDYLTGGHPGRITSMPWSIYLNNALRHPVVLYEISGLVIIGFVILNLQRFKKFEGFLFLVYVQLYAIQRMILDFFRIESTDPRTLGLTPSQFFVIIMFLVSLIILFQKYRLLVRDRRMI